MRKRRSRFHKHLSKFFLPSILGLSIILGLSVVYAVFSSPLNIEGQGTVNLSQNGKDFYYSEGYFYTSPNKEILVHDEKDNPVKTMKEAVEQISDGKTIYMMSSYSSSENEKISVSKKSIFIKRYVDEQYGGEYSFKDGPLIISPSDLEITVADSSSALVIDGSELSNPNSNYSGDNFQNCTGAIYSPSGSLILNGCPQTNNLIIQNHCGVSSAIYKQSGSFQMSNCKISNNLVGSSGAIVKVKVGDDSDSSLKAATCEISNSEFSENEGLDETTSVAAFDLNSTENQITSANLDEGIKVDITSCNISKNNLTALEFAAENSTGKYCNYSISNSTISNNTSNIGGINFVDAGGTIQDCSITDNKSTKSETVRNSSVGGISASSLPVILKGKNTVKNNLLSNKENSNLDFYPSSLVTNELSADSQIGLSCSSKIITETIPAITNPSTQSAAQTITYFFADDSEIYEVKLVSSNLQLAIKPTDYYYKNSCFYRNSNLTKIVMASDGNPVSSMQAAVDQITNEKTIYMLGKYVVSSAESISLSNKSLTIKRADSFTDASMFWVLANLTVEVPKDSSLVFDGNASVEISSRGGLFLVRDGATLSLQGSQKNSICLQNSKSSGAAPAILVQANGVLNANYMVVQNNSGSEAGALMNFGAAEITNSQIFNNSINTIGGGILMCGIDSSNSISLTNCRIEGNHADKGGAIHITSPGSIVNISNCTLTNNFARIGGGISINNYCKSLAINSCVISKNTATESGGGIYTENSTVVLTNTAISENQSVKGAGITINSGEIELTDNCSIKLNNAVEGNGGGILIDSSSNPTVHLKSGCEISENSSFGDGGGIYCNTNMLKAVGKILIEKNTSTFTRGNNNLYLTSNATLLNSSTSEKKFSPLIGSSIGISSEVSPTSSQKVKLSAGNLSLCLFSDNSNYTVTCPVLSNSTYLALKSS